MIYSIIKNDIVVNTIEWDGVNEWTPGPGLIAIQSDIAQIGWTYDGESFSPPIIIEPEIVPEPFNPRITKVRFGELFTMNEHAIMNLIRWQCKQMDATERSMPENPLTYAETLFFKFDLPAEFIELDLPMIADGLGLLGMLGVFGENAVIRIPQILTNELP